MEIDDAGARLFLDQFAYLSLDMGVGHVEQHRRRGTHQRPGPDGNDGGTDQPHRRIEPDPSKEAAAEQGGDGKHGSQGIGQDMDVGRAEIVVMSMSTLAMVVVVAMIVMMVVMVAAQKHGAQQIDQKAQNGNGRCFEECDGTRIDEAKDRLGGNAERHDAQDKRRGEAGEIADLAGAKAEPPLAGVASSQKVGDGCDRQRAGVGGHVEAIGQQSHRVEQQAGQDLADHHGQRQKHDPEHATGVAIVVVSQEDVIVNEVVGA